MGRRNQPSLGHIKPLSLNSNITMPRSKSTNIMSSSSINNKQHNIDNMNYFEQTPKISQISSRTNHFQNNPLLCHPDPIDFNLTSDHNDYSSASPPASSSIPSFDREDSDDEAKAQRYIKLLNPMRRIQSTPAISSMITQNDKQCDDAHSDNTQQIVNNKFCDTSPSAESVYKSDNAIIKTSEDGLLSYYGQDPKCTNFKEKKFTKYPHKSAPILKDRIHHSSLSSLRSTKDKKRRKKKEKRFLNWFCTKTKF